MCVELRTGKKTALAVGTEEVASAAELMISSGGYVPLSIARIMDLAHLSPGTLFDVSGGLLLGGLPVGRARLQPRGAQ
jgi:hypothetical protein